MYFSCLFVLVVDDIICHIKLISINSNKLPKNHNNENRIYRSKKLLERILGSNNNKEHNKIGTLIQLSNNDM
jgi:hypothetical protein